MMSLTGRSEIPPCRSKGGSDKGGGSPQRMGASLSWVFVCCLTRRSDCRLKEANGVERCCGGGASPHWRPRSVSRAGGAPFAQRLQSGVSHDQQPGRCRRDRARNILAGIQEPGQISGALEFLYLGIPDRDEPDAGLSLGQEAEADGAD